MTLNWRQTVLKNFPDLHTPLSDKELALFRETIICYYSDDSSADIPEDELTKEEREFCNCAAIQMFTDLPEITVCNVGKKWYSSINKRFWHGSDEEFFKQAEIAINAKGYIMCEKRTISPSNLFDEYYQCLSVPMEQMDDTLVAP